MVVVKCPRVHLYPVWDSACRAPPACPSPMTPRTNCHRHISSFLHCGASPRAIGRYTHLHLGTQPFHGRASARCHCSLLRMRLYGDGSTSCRGEDNEAEVEEGEEDAADRITRSSIARWGSGWHDFALKCASQVRCRGYRHRYARRGRHGNFSVFSYSFFYWLIFNIVN